MGIRQAGRAGVAKKKDKKDKAEKKARKARKAEKQSRPSKASEVARRASVAIINHPAVAEIVAATLVGAAAALRNPKKAKALAAAAGDDLQALTKEAAQKGSALWTLALDVGRKSLETLELVPPDAPTRSAPAKKAAAAKKPRARKPATRKPAAVKKAPVKKG